MAATPPSIHDCDRFAASFFDEQAVAPAVLPETIDINKALSACMAALHEFPNTARFQAQMARSLFDNKQDKEAIEWYQKAAEQGYPYAMASLGSLYLEGKGVSPDPGKAKELFEKAAQSGNGYASSMLGYMYAQGKGVSQDFAEAKKWFEKASTQKGGDTANTTDWLRWIDTRSERPGNR